MKSSRLERSRFNELVMFFQTICFIPKRFIAPCVDWKKNYSATNTIESINFNQDYNFDKPEFYNLVVNWNGDKECKEKYLKIKLCKIIYKILNII